ncbi:putative Suppressor of forked protein (Suf) [Blattamonas nauphoetae]|uniref:Suppressor of forked protein (Suf) n=1 Tax=Blattamonas nauphoetae TaxID=2049346 RepID=A0ABQ9Y4C7_9EUKA|nr:putative Suppressor of forked protein (Suf) [Blattamonas nauphoetae]
MTIRDEQAQSFPQELVELMSTSNIPLFLDKVESTIQQGNQEEIKRVLNTVVYYIKTETRLATSLTTSSINVHLLDLLCSTIDDELYELTTFLLFSVIELTYHPDKDGFPILIKAILQQTTSFSDENTLSERVERVLTSVREITKLLVQKSRSTKSQAHLIEMGKMWIFFASFFANRQKLDSAVSIYREAVIALPTFPIVTFSFAHFLQANGHYQEATTEYLSLISRLIRTFALSPDKKNMISALNDTYVSFLLFSRHLEEKQLNQFAPEARRQQAIAITRSLFLSMIETLTTLQTQIGALTTLISPNLFITAAQIEVSQNNDLQAAASIFVQGTDLFATSSLFTIAKASFLFHHLHKTDETRTCFERFLALPSNAIEADFWGESSEKKQAVLRVYEEYIALEQLLGNLNRVRVLEQRMNVAVDLGVSAAQRVADRYTFGTLMPCSMNEYKGMSVPFRKIMDSITDQTVSKHASASLLQPFANKQSGTELWVHEDDDGTKPLQTFPPPVFESAELFDPIFAVSLFSQTEIVKLSSSPLVIRPICSSLIALNKDLFDLNHPHFNNFQRWNDKKDEEKFEEQQRVNHAQARKQRAQNREQQAQIQRQREEMYSEVYRSFLPIPYPLAGLELSVQGDTVTIPSLAQALEDAIITTGLSRQDKLPIELRKPFPSTNYATPHASQIFRVHSTGTEQTPKPANNPVVDSNIIPPFAQNILRNLPPLSDYQDQLYSPELVMLCVLRSGIKGHHS